MGVFVAGRGVEEAGNGSGVGVSVGGEVGAWVGRLVAVSRITDLVGTAASPLEQAASSSSSKHKLKKRNTCIILTLFCLRNRIRMMSNQPSQMVGAPFGRRPIHIIHQAGLKMGKMGNSLGSRGDVVDIALPGGGIMDSLL